MVKETWVFKFSALYDGVPDDDPNFDNRFLNEVLANKHRQASSILDTSILNSRISGTEIKKVICELKA